MRLKTGKLISDENADGLEQLEAIFEHSKESIVVLDANLRILRLNGVASDRGKHFFGIRPEIGDNYQDFLFEETKPHFQAAAEKVLRGQPATYELQAAYDSSEIEIRSRVIPISIEGKVAQLMVFSEHVTHEEYLKKALNRSENRFKSIINDQTEMIVRWKPGGIRTFVNKAYCDAFSLTEKEALGKSFFELIAEEDAERVKERFDALSPEDPVSTSAHRVVYSDGRTGWQEWTDRGFLIRMGM